MGDLLSHGCADGLLQFVQGIVAIMRLLLVRRQRIRRQSKDAASCEVDFRITVPVGKQQLLHTFEDRVSTARQEGGQVSVDFGSQLSAVFPTLQLDAGRETALALA